MSSNRVDPIKTTNTIKENYLRYITSTFAIRNPELADKFKEEIKNSEILFKGPILQSNNYYKSGKSLKELINDGKITNEFLNYGKGLTEREIDNIISLERPLYKHQEKALLKIKENRNIIVATGTGSGKTESFLIPIIENLLSERKQKGSLGAGVRALLVYPMNALANDQILRIRNLLPPETGITFGRYTGQTKHIYDDALRLFKEENNQEEPKSNELISREQILSQPPNILLTNFAMLEYLLMRPDDSILFNYNNGDTWKFIVLDEAHTYSGALGTEIGYLVRRLKDRVCKSEKRKIRCIGTSATIGNLLDDKVQEQIIKFAHTLFGEEFEKSDLISPETINLEDRLKECWGNGDENIYSFLKNIPEFVIKDDLILYLKENINNDNLKNLNKKIFNKGIEEAEKEIDSYKSKSTFLFHILSGDNNIHKLLKYLEKTPQYLNNLSKNIFSEYALEDAQKLLDSIVSLSMMAKDPDKKIPLLSSRYHFFVSALEGLSIYWDKGLAKLKLGRHSSVDINGEKFSAFDLHSCKRCGETFLCGFEEDGKFTSYRKKTTLNYSEEKQRKYLSIDLKEEIEVSEDEEYLSDNTKESIFDQNINDGNDSEISKTELSAEQYLCTKCGNLSQSKDKPCSCGNNFDLEVRKVIPKVKNGKTDIIKTCPSCGSQQKKGSILYSFKTHEDMANFVLANSLFQSIPFTKENNNIKKNFIEEKKSLFKKKTDIKKIVDDKLGGKKRLLTFSDSRQDAAFFTTFMQINSDKFLHRQLIFEAIKELTESNLDNPYFSPKSLVSNLVSLAEKLNIFDIHDETNTKQNLVSKWIYSELCTIQPSLSLENLGLIKWEIDKKIKDDFLILFKENSDDLFLEYNIYPEELLNIIDIFLNQLRKKSVVSGLYNWSSYKDVYFWPRNLQFGIVSRNSNKKSSVTSWVPKSTRDNNRSDIMKRFYKNKKIDLPIDKLNDLLELLFNELCGDNYGYSIFKSYQTENEVAYQINNEIWRAKIISENDNLYRCNKCNNLTSINIGICPTYRCNGILLEENGRKNLESNYYSNLYKNGEKVLVEIKEHTAQISPQEGAERQKSFINDDKKLNILSCSTTFELGVDVGQLHAVYLKNIPPSTANYVQRAGRAARRLDSTAYILTFSRARSHDLSFFENADKLVSGEVETPRVEINNIDLARRHIHSVVLAQFWKDNTEYFGKQGDKSKGEISRIFFGENTICSSLLNYLNKKDLYLKEQLLRITPEETAKNLGIDNWSWVKELISEKDTNLEDTDDPDEKELNLKIGNWGGALGSAQTELRSEYYRYEKLKKDKPEYTYIVNPHLKRIEERGILQVLPSKKVLPKYGFPGDVVSLKLQVDDNWSKATTLDRDLKIAIKEYAPGCTLVANGKIIKSYALEKVVGRKWPEHNYYVCNTCGRFNISIIEKSLPEKCSCGSHDIPKKLKSFIEPIYGFTTLRDKEVDEPIDEKISFSYSLETYFSHYKYNDKSLFEEDGEDNKNSSGLKIEKKYDKHGVLVVLNTGKQNGFYICSYCGFGEPIINNKPKSHDTPFGKKCKNTYLKKEVMLGHSFQSDVLEIKFSGDSINNRNGQDFWLSLTAALITGASKALNIEEKDIDGTVMNYSGIDSKSIILFDTVPGGAGHVKLIKNNLKKVFTEAYTISSNCKGCSEDQSCNSCLRNYGNQYAHELLKRGPVSEFLRFVLESKYSENDYIRMGRTDTGNWLKNQIESSSEINLILEKFPLLDDINNNGRKWHDIINYSCNNNAKFNLFIKEKININTDKNTLKVLTWLISNYNFRLFNFDKEIDFNLLIKKEDKTLVSKWEDQNKSPISNPTEAIVFIKEHNISNEIDLIESLLIESKEIYEEKLTEAIGKNKVIRTTTMDKKGWDDLLGEYILPEIDEIYIYDRYIRNYFHFKSLKMFLEMLQKKCNNFNSLKINIETSYKEDYEKENQLKNFYFLKKEYPQIKEKIDMLTSDKKHERLISLKSKNREVFLINLDKGFDIFKFDRDSDSFRNQDSFILVTKVD